MEWYREKYTAELPEGRVQIFDSDTAVVVFSKELNKKITQETKAAQISRLFNAWMEKNGTSVGVNDIQEINRDARNKKRRAERYKRRKQMEQE